MESNGLNGIDPMKLAWLLRADLRRGLPASASVPDWFEMWWNVEGLREYPAWADHVPSTLNHLLMPMRDWPSYGVFGVSPALKYIFEQRKDLQDKFDLRSQTGQWQAIAWFYTHGIREYALTKAINSKVVEALDETPPFLTNSPEEKSPEITWLMYFVWTCSDELQRTFDLRISHGRKAYLQWYLFEGISNLELAPLVSDRWSSWLKEQVALEELYPLLISRACLLLWHRRIDLRNTFNLQEKNGREAFKLWAQNAFETETALSWTRTQSTTTRQIRKRQQCTFGVNLVGFAYGELGIGEDVRMAAAACEEAGIPYTVINIDPGKHLRQNDRSLAKQISSLKNISDAPYSVNIFCLTGFETARVALECGPGLFAGRYSIGWWPWELPVWPKDWHCIFKLVDEIWAATDFTFKMYTESVEMIACAPCIRKMPMAVSVDRMIPKTRQQLQLPTSRFLYLYVFDFNSYLSRKNPFALIQAFQAAFHADEASVGLVLKTMNSDPTNKMWHRFKNLCKRDRRITLVDRTMSRPDILALINACDAYVSLHRSEGFGRTLAEAMLLGKPVIGTNFSGTTDFLSAKNGYPVKWKRRRVDAGEYAFIETYDNAWWANPSVTHATHQLRAARSRPQFVTKNSVISDFSPKSVGHSMKARLNELSRSVEWL